MPLSGKVNFEEVSHRVQLVSFNLDDRQYALLLNAVIRIVRIVEITDLPQAPDIVAGVINLHGQIVPVFDIRKRFGLPPREEQLDDLLLIAQTSRRTVGLVVDSVSDVFEIDNANIVAGTQVLPGLPQVQGVAKLENGILVIHDLDRFLSLQEDRALGQAMEKWRQS